MKPIFIYIFFLFSMGIFAQAKVDVTVEKKIPLKANTFIGIDKYNALYYLKNKTLFKQTLTESFQFNDFQLGNIGSVDILNPLAITIFYPNYNIAVVLDNNLNEIKRISFAMEPPFLNVVSATTANDSRLWIFNADNQQVEIYNYRNNSKQELSRPIPENFITQKSNFNFCFLITEEKVRLYNIYGSLLQSIPNENYSVFSESNNRLIVKKENFLILFSEELKESQILNIPEIAIKDLFLRDEILYIYDGEFIHHLKLTNLKK